MQRRDGAPPARSVRSVFLVPHGFFDLRYPAVRIEYHIPGIYDVVQARSGKEKVPNPNIYYARAVRFPCRLNGNNAYIPKGVVDGVV